MYKNHIISTNNELRTSPYGWRVLNGIQEKHDGIDIVDGNRLEKTTNVYAVALADGVVVDTIVGDSIGCSVDILHAGNILTRQYHFKAGSTLVKVGQLVRKGDKLGILGTTGRSTGVHLHFGLKENSTKYNNGIYVDPEPYLRGEKTIQSKPSVPAQPKIGDALGKVLYTDIKAYINGHRIPVSVANSKTLVIAEDLKFYGFDIEPWDKVKRELRIERNKNKAFALSEIERLLKNDKLLIGTKSGDIKCDYVYTDIKTYLSNQLVESYFIDGRTLIDVELLKRYGKVKWDEPTKVLRLTLI